MFCPKCGARVEGANSFCGMCGTRIAPEDGRGDERQQAVSTGASPSESKEFPTMLWALIVVVFLLGVSALAFTQCSHGVAGTWYQENGYYGYSATLTVRDGSFELTDGRTTWSGSAQINGTSCTLDGEFEYELSPDGKTLTCTNDHSTGVYAGEWFRTRDDAAKFPRRQ